MGIAGCLQVCPRFYGFFFARKLKNVNFVVSFCRSTFGKEPCVSNAGAIWDRLAAGYDRRALDPVYMAAVRRVAAALEPRQADLVLDAGCGTGLPLRAYYRPGIRVCALDASGDSLARLGEAFPWGAVERVQADLLRLPFADRTFDRILCANTLQHLPTFDLRREAVAELRRVARPGARVVVSVHQWSRARQRAGWKKEGVPGGKGEGGYIYRFEPEEFATLLGRHFDGVRVHGAGFELPYRWGIRSLIRRLEEFGQRRACWTAWGRMLVGVGIRR